MAEFRRQQRSNFPVRVAGDKLLMTGPGNMSMRLWPMGDETFFVRAYVGEIKFVRDDSGKVTHADIKFEGRQAKMLRDGQ